MIEDTNEESRIQDHVYFGPIIGHKTVYQFNERVFHVKCLQSNSNESDSTGLRIYAGAHVGIRFISQHRELLDGRRVCEIGCGAGVVGLCACECTDLESIVLTDGSTEALALAEYNINAFQARSKASSQTLIWGDCDSDLKRSKFDVLIGCELMYYKLDMSSLISTVEELLNTDGIFIHAHIFRKPDQENELIASLVSIGWSTLEVPIELFVDAGELKQHPDWYNVRCLVSSRTQNILDLRSKYPAWLEFVEVQLSGDDNEESELGNLFG